MAIRVGAAIRAAIVTPATVVLVLFLFASFTETRANGAGEGRPFIGADIGAMIPTDELNRAVDPGATVAPFFGYMFNDYIGLMGQAHVWAGSTEGREGFNKHMTWIAGGAAGPRLALPLGPLELYTTFQAGLFTSLNDEALTDTSWGFSTGAGLNVPVSRNFSVGAFGRWNRLYQRVHGLGDAKYVTTGLSLTYQFHPEPEPPPPAPPVRAEAAPAPPPTPIPTRPAERHVIHTYVLQGVHFDFDRAQVRPEGRVILDEAISALQKEESHVVIVEGHTDSVGTEAYNQELSLRRARAVQEYLIAGGISSSRIEVNGFGESQPVADNATREGRAQNRRVELKVMGY